MNKNLNTLKIELENIFKEKLESIILYGSAATESFDQKKSDINLIIVINKLEALDLKKASPAIKKWIKTKNPPPILMGKEEWFNSCDVYAIECSDIKDRYKIIYGEDIVTAICLDKKNIRLQCESEIKNILIKLRQNYLLYNNDKTVIKKLIINSSKSIIAIFRAILKLHDEQVPPNHKDVINKLAEKLEFNHNIYIDILLFRENKKKISDREIEPTIQNLIDSLEKMLKYIDKFEV